MDERKDVDEPPETEVPLETGEGSIEIDPTEAVEEAEPYFPPTDPVVRLDRSGSPRIASGFGSGEVTKPSLSSDEALEDLAHRRLRLDASTAHLQLRVGVLNGVVRLQGPVDDEDDAENALAIAGDVPGVVEVIDEMTRVE